MVLFLTYVILFVHMVDSLRSFKIFTILQGTNMSSILYQYQCKLYHSFYFVNFSLYFLWLWYLTHFSCIGSVYCTSVESNPTPVYVVEGGEAVLQCGFESSKLTWFVYNGVVWNIIASGSDVIDSSKYSVSNNPLTGLYYILHILNVGVSDLKKYRCETSVNGGIQNFYTKLDLLSRYIYTSVIFIVRNIFYFSWRFGNYKCDVATM